MLGLSRDRRSPDGRETDRRGREDALQRLISALDTVLDKSHDASNALSTVLINVEVLRKSLAGPAGANARQDDIGELMDDLAAGLARLRTLVEETRTVGRDALGGVSGAPGTRDV